MGLSFEVHRRAAGQIILLLRGELDQENAGTFHQALATALAAFPSDLLLDLSMITAVGAGGLGVLLAVRRAADQLRCRLALQAASPAVRDELRARGLADDLRPVGTSGGAGAHGTA
ncbi:STAS domain-containing protein [Dactylosporangium sp. AC04546]|uniref:STAS domain-containing protein n=1 Tax=Dactylosporangium sp. AC04546 TaxID=2862460 RepID=UPI001EDCE873|nr:STAS domain-containing protein [Dactylosporangium sp. AC04546]WVK88200.1 STAS domain-containing protein [Dactylosporangium sp. AC04546]